MLLLLTAAVFLFLLLIIRALLFLLSACLVDCLALHFVFTLSIKQRSTTTFFTGVVLLAGERKIVFTSLF